VVIAQIEAHLLQPLVMGRAVSIHPLAVVLAICHRRLYSPGSSAPCSPCRRWRSSNNAMQVLLARDPAAEAEKQAEEGKTVLDAKPDDPQAEASEDATEKS